MLKNLKSNYSHALKEALVARAENRLTPQLDNQLGNCIYSTACWIIGKQVAKGELSRDMGEDEDLRSHVMLKVMEATNKVDLNMAPEQIITYLYNAGKLNGVKHYIRDMNCGKRKHDEVDLMDATLEVDFFGNLKCAGEVPAQPAFN